MRVNGCVISSWFIFCDDFPENDCENNIDIVIVVGANFVCLSVCPIGLSTLKCLSSILRQDKTCQNISKEVFFHVCRHWLLMSFESLWK